jgi:hypothetical protein
LTLSYDPKDPEQLYVLRWSNTGRIHTGSCSSSLPKLYKLGPAKSAWRAATGNYCSRTNPTNLFNDLEIVPASLTITGDPVEWTK